MNTIIFDDPKRGNLLPFTYFRPSCEIRIGIYKIREKWENWMGDSVSYLTADYLSEKYPVKKEKLNLLINGRITPDVDLLAQIRDLDRNSQIVTEDTLIAVLCNEEELGSFSGTPLTNRTKVDAVTVPTQLIHPWDIFKFNGEEIIRDYNWLCIKNRSQKIEDPHTIVYNPEMVYVEKGANIKAAVLNAENGPIYIGKNTSIGEGSLIRGPFALCENSHINMGTKIKGDTTVGPYCKVGGEISNSVFFGYSNKAHDGFMGNSVIAEWCNIGADTNTSNLKNNYSEIKIWNYDQRRFVKTGLIFCGLLMGDHSKCGINTMFNTATIVGVSANIFGSGFPRTLIPSFSWGGTAGFTTFQLSGVFEVAERMMARKELLLEEVDKSILSHIFEITAENRIWEKE
jgi:UDP-N-acetylglucosamine diphosphorylase/glucosamine-1-phosphate N-acetyltransferase